MDGKGKTILILGNGFDLAHGLPTGYASFIEFCSRVESISMFKGNAEDFYEEYIANWNIHQTLKEELDRVFVHTERTQIPQGFGRYKNETDFQNQIVQELYDCTVGNIWITYFDELLSRNIARGENWIDFEAEISIVIEFLDQYTQDLRQTCRKLLNITEFEIAKIDIFLEVCEDLIKKMSAMEIRDLRERLYDDLEKLTRALEIYLSHFVEKITVTQRLKCIADLNPDYVINFNYTHTYERLYKKASVFHIHGECNFERPAYDNNMVLGIDEYLADDDRDINTNYAIFKKFVQRLRKKTGTEHYKYIRAVEKAYEKDGHLYTGTADIENVYADGISHVYVFGHSLDITDKDILKLFFEPESTAVTIFCKDKGTEGELIANMIKLIREERLIFKANQRPPLLEFVRL